MKLWLAAGLVLVVNAVVLVGVRSNRLGVPEARVELGARELYLRAHGTENTAVSLQLQWRPYWWADNLEAVDVSCHAYRAADRVAYLALALDEPGARSNLEEFVRTQKDFKMPENFSRLRVVAFSDDPAALRRRFPDRSTHLILRGGVHAYDYYPPGAAGKSAGERCMAMRLDNEELHVPSHLAGMLRSLGDASPGGNRYTIMVAVGRNFEPWVEQVQVR